MGLFAPSGATVNRTTGTIACSTHMSGTNITISYSCIGGNYSRGNKHVDIDRLAGLQKLVTKNPNRTDLKMELMKLQSRVKPKIGKRKKKK